LSRIRAGPLGQVITSPQGERPSLRVGAVGLGAGAVAAYGRATHSKWFVEIDPAVVAIARDPTSFTFLADFAASIQVVVAEGRIELEDVAAAPFDLLVLDAFSSDAVPVHLLPVETLALGMASLALGGVGSWSSIVFGPRGPRDGRGVANGACRWAWPWTIDTAIC